MKKFIKKLGKKAHQKTALADGFNASVVGKPSIVPHTLLKYYHKVIQLSNVRKTCAIRIK